MGMEQMGREILRAIVAKRRLDKLEVIYSDRLFEICALNEAQEVDELTKGVHVLYQGLSTSFQKAYPGQTRTLRDKATKILEEEEVAAEVMTEGEAERQIIEEEQENDLAVMEENVVDKESDSKEEQKDCETKEGDETEEGDGKTETEEGDEKTETREGDEKTETETGPDRQTRDNRPQTADRRPQTADHRPETRDKNQPREQDSEKTEKTETETRPDRETDKEIGIEGMTEEEEEQRQETKDNEGEQAAESGEENDNDEESARIDVKDTLVKTWRREKQGGRLTPRSNSVGGGAKPEKPRRGQDESLILVTDCKMEK